ncbi:MAG UNVERIFIED_CONTAM: hypothetical protein LVR18_14320 [Planctomycetaceae bacterium]
MRPSRIRSHCWPRHSPSKETSRAPDLPLTLHGRTLEVTRTNLHTPTNANLDSGLAAQSLNLQISEQVLVTGWLRADSALNIETTATTGENPLQSFPNGANSFKGDVGADVRTLLPGSQLTITASGSVLVAATLQALGAGSQLQVTAGTRFELQQGGILKTSGADSQLQINGGQSFLARSGSRHSCGRRIPAAERGTCSVFHRCQLLHHAHRDRRNVAGRQRLIHRDHVAQCRHQRLRLRQLLRYAPWHNPGHHITRRRCGHSAAAGALPGSPPPDLHRGQSAAGIQRDPDRTGN